jgi:hypothetical protein
MKKKTRTLIAKIIAAVLVFAMVAALLLPLFAEAAETNTAKGAAYPTKWSETYNMADIMAPALLRDTDPNGVAQQLALALRYGSITQGDIWRLYSEGFKIPVESLKILSDNGVISGYLYKTAADLPLEPADLKDVYDPVYFANTEFIQNAIAAGTIPNDAATIFQVFTTIAMGAGIQGSSEFNPAYFKANYPDVAKAIGDDNLTYYIYYILIGKQQGMEASKLISQK